MGTRGSIAFENGYPTAAGAASANDETDLRRAVEAYRFFYPTVSQEGIFHGSRVAGAADNRAALLLLAQPRHAVFTANSDTPYSGALLDLREAGPMVVDLPAGPLIGLIQDHHQRWIADVGIPGEDAGRGGRYVVLPPGYDGEPPGEGYLAHRSDTHLAFCAVRALPVGGDVERAKALLRSVRVYPLARADDPPEFAYVDVEGTAIDCTCLSWEDNLEYWRRLHGVVDAEPAVEEMRAMLGTLAELGVEADRPFAPDERMTAILERAARTGRDELLVAAFASRRPDRIAWEDRGWEWVGLRPENGAFERAGSLDVEARDRWFAQAIIASPAMFRRAVGQGSLYWLGHRDASGRYLDGGRAYRLRVPLPVPAKLFWSVTIYDARTRSEVDAPQQRAALRSLFELRDAGGDHVDLFFGPERPDGAEGRWLQTVPGRGWFSYFRIYGPEEPAFDGGWRPGDFEAV